MIKLKLIAILIIVFSVVGVCVDEQQKNTDSNTAIAVDMSPIKFDVLDSDRMWEMLSDDELFYSDMDFVNSTEMLTLNPPIN